MTQIETLEYLVNSQLEQIRAQQQTNQMLAESNQKLTDQSKQLQKKIDELLSQPSTLRKKKRKIGCTGSQPTVSV